MERRAYECRLTPDRALASLDEAEAFLRDRGLMTRTADCSLPSLHEACHEDPYAPGRGGFGVWPRTKWRWGGALAERDGVVASKIHRGKTLYLTDATAMLADPICRSEIQRLEEADPAWAGLLRHLAGAGPSELGDVRIELGLKPQELKSLRSPLERCGAIVSRPLVVESGRGHSHTSELVRWDQLFPEPAPGPAGLAELIVAGVRAAVIVPDAEPRTWFSWSWHLQPDLIEGLVASGRLEAPESGWLSVSELG